MVSIGGLLSAWVVGHKVCCPPKKLRNPPWDLLAVFVALAKDSYEHLWHIDMQSLTYKVLFLVAFSSLGHFFLIERVESFNLALNPFFLSKDKYRCSLLGDIELQYPSATWLRRLSWQMCPVRFNLLRFFCNGLGRLEVRLGLCSSTMIWQKLHYRFLRPTSVVGSRTLFIKQKPIWSMRTLTQ